MCNEHIQNAMLQCLEQIAHSVSSDQYETSDPYTIGGATGNYQVSSPYNTECEWAIVSAMATGTLASAATFALGSKNPKQPTLSSTGADSFGNVATTGRDNNNALPAYVGALTSQASFITYQTEYLPLPSPSTVYLTTTTPASSEVLVTVIFRRKLDRTIPDKPRQQPQTHTHPQSRRAVRALAAQSPMVAGFANQYPQEGVPYQHEGIPETQDTGVARRGLFPLGKQKGSSNGR